MKGTGFSPSVAGSQSYPALAAEGLQMAEIDSLRAKALFYFGL
jgi:hypothetical protein